MVDLLKRLNSKNGSSKVIIAVIVAVLIVAAATTGVVIYNHNSNKPEAADTEVNALEQEISNDADTNSSNNGTVDATNDNVENNTNNVTDNNNVNANTNTNNVAVNQNDNVVNNNNVATNNNAGVAANQNGNGINNNVAVNQQNGEDTYIQKVIEEETTTKEWENVDVSWEAAAISGAVIPADTATRKPVINLTKESSATNVTTADEITYTITAENTGNLNAKNIVVTDKINEEFVSIISVNDNGNVDNDTLTWNIENINAGEKVSVSFVVKVNEISDEKVKESDKIEITNTAYATGENIKDTHSEEIKNDYEKEIITAEKEAFIIRNGEEVKITKDDTTSVVPGETLKYRVTVKNEGTLTKTFEIKDILPDQVENINIISTSNGNASVEGNTIIWNTEIAKRDENKNATVQTIEYTVSIKENATGNVKNAVVIDGEEMTSVKTPIVTFSKSSTIVTENEGYVTTDSIVRYDILVTNTSEDVKATSIQVTDMVPVGTTLLENETYSVSDNGNVENGKITWNLDIEKSSTKTVSFYVVVNENDDDIQVKNVAYVNDKKTNETDDDYVKPRYDYVVNYYKDSISDDNFIDKITGEKYINEEVTADITYKIPTGYKFEGETPKMIIGKEGNVLNVVYVKDNFNYTVEYYKDGELFETSDKIEATYGDLITTYADKKPTGYKLDRDTAPLTITENEAANVIKVYYVKDNFSYTVEYFKDGEETPFEISEKIEATYGDLITTYADKKPTGYKLDRDTTPLTITENEATNVIKVYYVKDNFNYTVEYYKDGEENPFKVSEKISATYGDTITTYPDAKPTGYKLDRDTTPLTITENETTNVIKVYYVKDNFNYTVEYYKDGEENPFKVSERISATYGDTITTYPDAKPTGYKLDRDTTPLTITENETTNVIKVYYVKDNFNYTVEYYKDGEESPFITSEKISATYGEQITTYQDKKPAGYKLDHDTTPLTITENEETNVIKVYYVKGNFNYTVEYYKDGEERPFETSEKINATYGDIITSYESKQPIGYRLDHDTAPLTVTENETANVLKVYYVKDNFNYTVEYYKDGEESPFEVSEKISATYGDTITIYPDAKPTGYKLDRDTTPLTITENEETNVIKVYYVKDNFNYTVEYYKDGEETPFKVSEKISATYGDTITTYPDETPTGYKLDRDTTPLTITENETTNVIKVYYVKEIYKYTVTYNFEGTKLAEYKDILSDTPHQIQEFMGVLPEGKVFTGVWIDGEGNRYEVGTIVNVTRNIDLYAEFKDIQEAVDEIGNFWQNKLKAWGPSYQNIFDPVVINGKIEHQAFYCKTGNDYMDLQNNGGIDSIYDENDQTYVITNRRQVDIRLVVGHTYTFNVNKGSVRTITVEARTR